MSSDHHAEYVAPQTCRHCGAMIIHNPGHVNRYAWSDRPDGTDIFGSGSECPKNERGHEPTLNDGLVASGPEQPYDERLVGTDLSDGCMSDSVTEADICHDRRPARRE